MVGCELRLMKKTKLDWLKILLESKFFGYCGEHREVRKNEENVFCIDCKLRCCKHCIASSAHSLHRWLQICKYVYQDVVRLHDIQKFLDSSKIQTYKINGEKAIHLNPRPQMKDPKSTKSKSGVPCEACGRHIQDHPNRFCSIACKVSKDPEMSNFENGHDEMISVPTPELGELSLKESYGSEIVNVNEKESTTSPISLRDSSSLSVSQSSEELQAGKSLTLKPRKRLNKRKGIPRRAALR